LLGPRAFNKYIYIYNTFKHFRCITFLVHPLQLNSLRKIYSTRIAYSTYCMFPYTVLVSFCIFQIGCAFHRKYPSQLTQRLSFVQQCNKKNKIFLCVDLLEFLHCSRQLCISANTYTLPVNSRSIA
jgi:hypothetical protein